MGSLRLTERRRPQTRMQRIWTGNLGIIGRAVAAISVVLAAYYGISARLQVMEARQDLDGKTIDKIDSRIVKLQEEIDDMLKLQSAQQAPRRR